MAETIKVDNNPFFTPYRSPETAEDGRSESYFNVPGAGLKEPEPERRNLRWEDKHVPLEVNRTAIELALIGKFNTLAKPASDEAALPDGLPRRRHIINRVAEGLARLPKGGPDFGGPLSTEEAEAHLRHTTNDSEFDLGSHRVAGDTLTGMRAVDLSEINPFEPQPQTPVEQPQQPAPEASNPET